MSDFAAAFLVIMALAAVGNFASDEKAFSTGCTGTQLAWIKIC